MKFNKALEYGIIVVEECNKKEPTKLANIADKHKISIYFLEQVSAKLRRAGLVRSIRGPGGGYLLDNKGKRITMMEIHDAINETPVASETMLPYLQKIEKAAEQTVVSY